MESGEFGSYITNAYGILKVIFSYLNGDELLIAARVCREWNEVASRILHGSNYFRNYVRRSNIGWDKIDPKFPPSAALHFIPRHQADPAVCMPTLKKYHDTNRIPMIAIANCQNIFYDPEKPYDEDNVMDFLLMFPKLPGVNIKFIYAASSTLLSYSLEYENGVAGAIQEKVLEHTCYDCAPSMRRKEETPCAKVRRKKEVSRPIHIPPCASFRRKRLTYMGPRVDVPCAPPPDLSDSKGVILITKQSLARRAPEPPSFFFGKNIRLAGGVTSSIYMMDPDDPKSHKIDMLGISFSGDNVETHAGLHKLNVCFDEFLEKFSKQVGPLAEGYHRVAFMFTCINRFVFFQGSERSRFSEFFPGVPVYGFHSLGEFYLSPAESDLPHSPPPKKFQRMKDMFFYQECTSFLIVTYKRPSSF